MLKYCLLILIFILGTNCFAQIIPTLPSKPKTVTPKPKTVVKTKIIYRDKPAEKPKNETKTFFEPDMVSIPGGSFNIGSSDGEEDEKPVHRVTVSSFKMGKYEVTVKEFAAFVAATNYQTDAEK
jgi:formylglycine-generating enzyme required for sulfatase activity